MATHQPKVIIHFAAESHVDNSIEGPEVFIRTNIEGTFKLLQATKRYVESFHPSDFRFIHISTDEVFGSLELSDPSFTETTFYSPTTPYSASKACSDHLVSAWYHTYKIPSVIMHCSNNYGPHQYGEKLIPKVIGHASRGEPITVYGNGKNIRDWIHVDDHCSAIMAVLDRGKIGESYNVGGNCEKTNIEVVRRICDIMDGAKPIQENSIRHPISGEYIKSYHELITYTEGRKCDDRRYSMDISKIQRDLGWCPRYTFKEGIDMVTRWYLADSAAS